MSLVGDTPAFLYGTAWKEERTTALAETAIEQGFRGIDTANQRKHYFEVAVGKAISNQIEKGTVSRDDYKLECHAYVQRRKYRSEVACRVPERGRR